MHGYGVSTLMPCRRSLPGAWHASRLQFRLAL